MQWSPGTSSRTDEIRLTETLQNRRSAGYQNLLLQNLHTKWTVPVTDLASQQQSGRTAEPTGQLLHASRAEGAARES